MSLHFWIFSLHVVDESFNPNIAQMEEIIATLVKHDIIVGLQGEQQKHFNALMGRVSEPFIIRLDLTPGFLEFLSNVLCRDVAWTVEGSISLSSHEPERINNLPRFCILELQIEFGREIYLQTSSLIQQFKQDYHSCIIDLSQVTGRDIKVGTWVP
ncbi:hypothetical protein GF325_05995 [Candidatus Bathyarchaeota archaeon]|nr:hypothetical protein [Candidatus Bathyarchaeota archaeon]